MSDNPIHSPQIAGQDQKVRGGSAEPKMERIASLLRQTKPWVRIISVVMFISCAFMIVGGILIVISSVGEFGGFTQRGFGGVAPAVGGIYVVIALLYIVPATFLWNYADGIKVFLDVRTTVALATALEKQKSFWKFVGIMMAIVLGLYAALVVWAIVVRVM